MILQAMVFVEVLNKWPARNGKPGGERYEILCLDMTVPSSARLRDMYHYALSDEERTKYAGALEGKFVKIAVNDIFNGQRAPVLRGALLEVNGGGTPAAEPAAKAK